MQFVRKTKFPLNQEKLFAKTIRVCSIGTRFDTFIKQKLNLSAKYKLKLNYKLKLRFTIYVIK